MVKIGIITSNAKSKTSVILYETARKLNIDAEILTHKELSIIVNNTPGNPSIINNNIMSSVERPISEFNKNINLKDFSGFINRGIGTQKIFKIYYRLGLFSAIEEIYGNGSLINSRECMELSTNKMLTSIILNKYNIPTPKTIICENKKIALSNLDKFESQIIVKPLFGSKGSGIFKIKNLEYAEHLFETMARFDEPFYLQEYLETSQSSGNNENRIVGPQKQQQQIQGLQKQNGQSNNSDETWLGLGNNDKKDRKSDIRLFVIDGRVISSMKRISNAQSWKTNIAKGGKALPYKPTEEQEELAIKSSEAVKGEIIGVDLIESGGKNYIIEVNAVPGFLGLQKVTTVNIAGEILKYCKNKLKK